MAKKTSQKQVKHDCRTCRNGGRENNFICYCSVLKVGRRASHTFVETLCAVGQQAEAVARIRRITAVGLSAGCSSGGEGQRKK